jgi:proline iminopeptidase
MSTTTRPMLPGPAPTAGPAGGRPLPPGNRSGLAVVAAVGLDAAAGVAAAAILPRGPVTRPEALLLMLSLLLVGAATGLLLRSRWAILLAPAGYLTAFTVARATVLDVEGVLFGPVQLGHYAGVLLFVVGHLFHALVTAPPLMLGAIAGAAHTRRAAPWPVAPVGRGRRIARRAGRGIRIAVTGLLAVSVAVLGYQLATPGEVAPVLGSDGEAVTGSIAVQRKVTLGGADQWVSIRGRGAANPVLLYLSGGPGGSDLALVRWNERLEDRFTVVVWEQRGTGMSYPAIDPTGDLTLDRLVSDGIELTHWLRATFDQEKIYLVGNSWGTILGVLMAQQQPELFWAYVGTGQMVSVSDTDRTLYEQSLSYAERTGDRALADRLRRWGAPPYDDPLTDALVHASMGLLYEDLEPYDLAATEVRPNTMTERFFNSEYGLLDSWNSLRGLADMFSVVYPQLQDVDFRVTATRLDLPVYVLEGRHELSARRLPAVEWYAALDAPSKNLIWFERSGHNPQFEEATRYTELMTGTILEATYRSG